MHSPTTYKQPQNNVKIGFLKITPTEVSRNSVGIIYLYIIFTISLSLKQNYYFALHNP